jgi:hypothetical protein
VFFDITLYTDILTVYFLRQLSYFIPAFFFSILCLFGIYFHLFNSGFRAFFWQNIYEVHNHGTNKFPYMTPAITKCSDMYRSFRYIWLSTIGLPDVCRYPFVLCSTQVLTKSFWCGSSQLCFHPFFLHIRALLFIFSSLSSAFWDSIWQNITSQHRHTKYIGVRMHVHCHTRYQQLASALMYWWKL